MYETRHQRPIPRRHFVRRVVIHAFISTGMVTVSLFAGMLGYVVLERLTWIEAFLNAAMLLGGMGPVDMPKTDGGRLFAGLYALYAGMIFLISVGFFIAPGFHRMMHRFHWKEGGGN